MFMGWSFFFKNKESPYFLSFKGIVIAYGVPLLAFQYNLEWQIIFVDSNVYRHVIFFHLQTQ